MNIEQIQKESDIVFLRTACVTMFNTIVTLNETLNKYREDAKDKEGLRLDLADQLTTLKKKYFGASSEKLPRLDRPGRKAEDDILFHNRVPEEVRDVPTTEDSLPVDEVLHELSGGECLCKKCGGLRLREMKGQEETSSEITVTERVYTKLLHKRKKYTCDDCSSITTAPGPDKIKEGLSYSTDFIVQVALDKYLYHLPLERQRRQMASAGLTVSCSTLFGLIAGMSDRFYRLCEDIRKEIVGRQWMHIDETPMKILEDNKLGYIWGIANSMGCYYQFELGRSGDYALELCKGFAGTALSDGFVGYNKLKNAVAEGVTKCQLAHCWGHVRRKLFEAMLRFPDAKGGVELIGKLYEIEHRAKSFEELRELRDKESRKIVAEFREWMDARLMENRSKSSIAKACAYAKKLWPGLTLFLDNPYVPLDNNGIERGLRGPVMGRKNYMGFRTINGADVAMTYYTLIESCKVLKINPARYLHDIAHAAARKEELLTPYRYALRLKAELQKAAA